MCVEICHDFRNEPSSKLDLLKTSSSYHMLKKFEKEKFPEADRVRVAIRKLNPPLEGHVAYAQVCLDE